MERKIVKIIVTGVFLLAVAVFMSGQIAAQTVPEIDGVINADEYRGSVETEIGMEVYWNNDEENLYIGLTSPGEGWLAFGFEPTLRMRDASIIIAAFEDGEPELSIESHMGTSPTAHAETEEDFISNYSGSVTEAGIQVLEFVIPFSEDFIAEVEEGETYTLILAYHETDKSFSARHTARTAVEIEF
ncbi:MAG: DOMON domain-containing protein [Halarsenatibacteraceae bacterium]